MVWLILDTLKDHYLQLCQNCNNTYIALTSIAKFYVVWFLKHNWYYVCISLTQSSHCRYWKTKKLPITCCLRVLRLFCLQKHRDNLSRLFKKNVLWLTKPIKRIMKQELVYDCVEKKFNCWSMKPSLRPSLPDSPKLKLKNHHFGSLVSENSKLKILGIVFLVNLKWWRIANSTTADYI